MPHCGLTAFLGLEFVEGLGSVCFNQIWKKRKKRRREEEEEEESF